MLVQLENWQKEKSDGNHDSLAVFICKAEYQNGPLKPHVTNGTYSLWP